MKLCLVVAFIALILMPGCGLRRAYMQRGTQDTVDRDFVATIQKTKEPYVFEINVRKVNQKVDKKIGGFCVVVDLVLKDNAGKTFAAAEGQDPYYASEVGNVFNNIISPSVDSLIGRIRLVRRDLAPGNYTVEPRVRIYEDGKDKLSGGRFGDGGTVAVPPGNSINVDVKPAWSVKPLEDPKDVVDSDFAATIALTNTPNVFLIEAKRVKSSVDKTINTHHDVFVDLELVDEKGRVYKGDFQIKTFAEDVSDELAANDASPYPTSRKGRVRLITTSLSPGIYTIKPNVRIVEEGKNRAENSRADFGSVKVPAANSLKVTITK